VEDHGVQLRKLPDDVLAKLKSISETVVAEAASEDELSARIYASYTDFKNEVGKYHALSEQAYLNAR
jgi:TRAP-type mannitol/chloroaromatic compound transport system substrate-binding protein